MLVAKLRHLVSVESGNTTRCLGSLIVVLVATAIQSLLWPVINPAPYLLFYPAVIVSALIFDGTLAVILSAIVIQFFFGEPRFQLNLVWPADYARLSIFLLSGISIVMVTKALKRAQKEVLADQAMLEKAFADLQTKNKKLAEKNRELTHFASIAAHDLQSPLVSISGFTDLIVMEMDGQMTPEVRDYFKFISSAVNRMSSFIDGLLEFAKVGIKIKDFKDVDLENLISETTENLKAQLKNSGAQLTVASLPKVKGDKIQLMILFQNLIANAIKYRVPTRAPEILLRGKEESNHWTISVTDNGSGFDPKDKDKIFDLFSRVHPKANLEGSGIGLATAKRIVDSHCGEIWVDTQLGKGTTFFVRLPKEPKAEDCVSKEKEYVG